MIPSFSPTEFRWDNYGSQEMQKKKKERDWRTDNNQMVLACTSGLCLSFFLISFVDLFVYGLFPKHERNKKKNKGGCDLHPTQELLLLTI